MLFHFYVTSDVGTKIMEIAFRLYECRVSCELVVANGSSGELLVSPKMQFPHWFCILFHFYATSDGGTQITEIALRLYVCSVSCESVVANVSSGERGEQRTVATGSW